MIKSIIQSFYFHHYLKLIFNLIKLDFFLRCNNRHLIFIDGLHFKLGLFFFFSFFQITYGQPLELNGGKLAKINNHPFVYKSIPKYLVAVKDSFFNTQITRITDTFFIRDSISKVAAHQYAKNQPWNSDGTLIKLHGWPSAILDGKNYQFKKWIVPPSGHHVWSNIKPNIIYGIQDSNKLVSFNVYTNEIRLIHQFKKFKFVSLGEFEGNISNNDRYFVFQAFADTGNFIFVYDLVKKFVASKIFIDKEYPDNVTMSQSGKYVIVQWKNAAEKNCKNSNIKGGIELYSNKLKFIRRIHNCNGCHYDVGYDDAHNEIVTYIDYQKGNLVFQLLKNGKTIELLNKNKVSWNVHLSCRDTKRGGWVYLSEYNNEEQKNNPNSQLVIAVKMSQREKKIKIYSYVNHSITNKYEHAAFAVPDRFGKKVMFRSDWNNAQGFIFSYVAE